MLALYNPAVYIASCNNLEMTLGLCQTGNPLFVYFFCDRGQKITAHIGVTPLQQVNDSQIQGRQSKSESGKAQSRGVWGHCIKGAS